MKIYGINCQGPVTLETVSALPSASGNAGREVYYNNKRYYCDGSDWIDYSDADLLNGQVASWYQPESTALKTATSFAGDVSGLYNTIAVTDDSHNHIIANVDGLQTALDGKQASGSYLTTSTSFGGDVSGTYGAISVTDDSHNHIISNVDNLQTTLDAKLSLTGGTMTGNLSIISGSTTMRAIIGSSGGSVVGSSTHMGFYKSGDAKYARFAATSTDGDFQVTGDVSAYYSDIRLKTVLGNINNALESVKSLTGFRYVNNDLAKSFGYTSENIKVGLSAQQVQQVLPEAVTLAPFDCDYKEDGTKFSKSGEYYLTINYEKLVPLLIEAIKEQQVIIESNIEKIARLEANINKI